MFLLVTDEDLSIYINHCCKDIREKEEKSHFGIYPKILSQGWYWWGVWETWWKSSMQTGKFLLVTDTRKRVRRKVLKKSSRPTSHIRLHTLIIEIFRLSMLCFSTSIVHKYHQCEVAPPCYEIGNERLVVVIITHKCHHHHQICINDGDGDSDN